ncbi:LemA family protein [Candidatus Woesearchaeota archaeon]|nr:MAG: LemA family protein [Candidatus Woesearchaeota archaeon]
MSAYNSLVALDTEVEMAWANVESAYQRRADLIPNLVETVKGARDFEQETLTEITKLRSEAGQAKVQVDSAASPEQLATAASSMDSVLSRLLVIVENYPELKSNENFLSLQDELAGTENRIKIERDRYNKAVRDYNRKVRSFPANIVASMFGFEPRESFSASPGAEEAPKVGFN